MPTKTKERPHPDRWLGQFKDDLAYAEKRLLEKGELTRMLGLHFTDENGKRNLLMVPALVRNAEENQSFYKMIRLLTLAYNVEAIGHFTEAWMRSVARHDRETEAEYQARVEAVPPSQAEDRVEALMVILSYRQQDDIRHIAKTQEILRDEQGKIVGFKLIAGYDAGSFEGQAADLLPRRTVPRQAQRQLRAELAAIGITAEKLSAGHA